MEERLRFDWVPLLVWKVRPDESTQAICYRWTKSIFTTKKEGDSVEIHEEYVYDFYYDKEVKQDKETSFDKWIGELFAEDKPYLNNSLWQWIGATFTVAEGFSGIIE